MRNTERWKPSKFAVLADGSVRCSSATGELGAGSILGATLVGRWYARVLPLHAAGRLVELGCGKLPMYGMYRPHVDDVVCTDWPNTLHGRSFMDFAADLNAPLPLAAGMCDTVVASDVLEHLYRPRQLLCEVARILRPGGKAIINMPFMYRVHEAPHDYFRYTAHAIRRMAEDAGLEVVELKSIGGWLVVVTDLFGKALQRIPLAGRFLAVATQRLVLWVCPHEPLCDVFPLVVAAVLRKPA